MVLLSIKKLWQYIKPFPWNINTWQTFAVIQTDLAQQRWATIRAACYCQLTETVNRPSISCTTINLVYYHQSRILPSISRTIINLMYYSNLFYATETQCRLQRTHNVGGRPLHNAVIPSFRAILTNASFTNNYTQKSHRVTMEIGQIPQNRTVNWFVIVM